MATLVRLAWLRCLAVDGGYDQIEEAASGPRGTEAMKILIMEDEPRLAQALVELLRDEAYAVDHAPNGTAAEELAAVNDYDLAVMD